MTLAPAPRTPDFPENPEDGFQIKEELPNGGYVLWTYSKLFNEWTCQVYTGSIPGYVTTRQVLSANASTAVRQMMSDDDRDETADQVFTQEEINNELAYRAFNSVRKTTRRETNLDFVQNTVIDGQWKFYEPEISDGQLPPTGEFYIQDGEGHVTNEWAKAKSITINGTDSNQRASLAEIRKGQTLLIQDVVLNTFVQYVVLDVSFIGKPEGGQFWVEAGLLVAYNRAVGIVPDDTVCEIKFTKPRPCICTKRGGEPIVDDDGYLWYNEINQTLYVSDWNDEQGANGDATWIPVGSAGEGGGQVHVGENPPVEELGAEWFDTNRLELFVFYVDGDGNGGWLPSSPLGARVEAGEALQQQLVGRVDALEARNPDDYLKKTGGTLTGTLKMKRTDDVSYWNYIQSDTPNAWHADNKSHGLILNIGTSNSFKQQFKIQGRSGRDLFEIHDDGHAVASLKGDLNCTDGLKLNGKPVATEEYAAETYLKRAGGTSSKMQGILYLGGHKIAGVAEPERSDDAATRGYVDNAVSSGGGGSFQTKYDGNRFCLGQDVVSSTLVESGQVAFYGDASFGTTAPQNVRFIGLSIDEFNWDSFIGSGIIRVRNGANDAGYYQVYKRTENAGRNMILHVSPVWSDVNQVLQGDSGTPVYFQGVFFE